jgi:2-polyprenyl-3-methyl-5-hydroxy-6-metoxy-1,4-benzoquinol methylase
MTDLDQFAGAYKPEFEYSFDNSIMLPAYARRVTEWLSPDTRLLDYGLGHGHVAEIFSKYFASHTVVEGYPSVIALAKGRLPDTFIEHSMFEDYIRPSQFDVAVLGFVLEHVDDPAELLRIAAGNTHSGQVIVAVPNCESLHRRIGLAAGMLEQLDALSEADLLFGHQRFFCLGTLRNLLIDADFVIEDVEGIFLKPITTAQLQQLDLPDSVLSALCDVGQDFPELSNGLLVKASLRNS